MLHSALSKRLLSSGRLTQSIGRAIPTQISRTLVSTPRVLTSKVLSRPFSQANTQRSHADNDLAQKLAEELQFENDAVPESEPAFLQEFLKRGSFKIEDKVGDKEIVLTRTFGNEKISVIFSTDALHEEPDLMEEEVEEAGNEEEGGFPVRVNVIVQKNVNGVDAGALEISATASYDAFFIDHVSYSPNSSLLDDTSAEGDWQRRGIYGGPVFEDLDESLQQHFHAYMEERGLDASLAKFIPEYVEYKEQQEYKNWLKSVGDFVRR